MNASTDTIPQTPPPIAQVGHSAPNFTLLSQDGQPITLSSFRGKSSVVLFFYPKDFTPGCTKEACQFRDQYQDFENAGAALIGVSADPLVKHQQFAQTHRLPFLLLSDSKNEVRKAYGVPKSLGLWPGRVTYVIDRDGIVRHCFNSQFDIQGHVRKALAVLKDLA